MVAGGVAVLGHRGDGTPVGGEGPGTTGVPTTAPNGTGAPGSPTQSGQSLVAAPGQYYYWKFAVVYANTTATLRYWWSPDGTGRMASSAQGDGYGVPPDGELHVGKFPVGDDLSGLSTDPEELLPQLVRRSSDDGASPRPVVTPRPGQTEETGRLVSAVEDLLSEMAPHSSPELRVALYGVLSGIGSVQDLGAVQDPTGRPAVALRVRLDVTVRTFYFDPDTHLFLAEEEAIAPDAAPELSGDTSSTFLIVQSGGIVDSDTEVPTDQERIIPEAGPLPTP
jgi:hypothetical protein